MAKRTVYLNAIHGGQVVAVQGEVIDSFFTRITPAQLRGAERKAHLHLGDRLNLPAGVEVYQPPKASKRTMLSARTDRALRRLVSGR